MRIVVVGAGSLGSLVGGFLAEHHEVTLLGRTPQVRAIRQRGLRITGRLERSVYPAAVTEPPPSADLAVVTVKSYDTETVGEQLSPMALEATLSLQNGMGNESILADALACPVLAGTCTYGAKLEKPGVVECTGLGSVTLGPRHGGESSVATRVGTAFETSALQTAVVPDMPTRLWEKLAVNAGINPTTALAGVENGALLEGPAGDIADAAATEAARVARAEGIDLQPDRATERLQAVAQATASNHSSMRQDLEAGNRTEIDAINGYVVDHATDPVPVNETLAGLVTAWEAARGLRGE